MICDICGYDHPGEAKLCPRCECDLRRDLELRKDVWRDAEAAAEVVKMNRKKDEYGKQTPE